MAAGSAEDVRRGGHSPPAPPPRRYDWAHGTAGTSTHRQTARRGASQQQVTSQSGPVGRPTGSSQAEKAAPTGGRAGTPPKNKKRTSLLHHVQRVVHHLVHLHAHNVVGLARQRAGSVLKHFQEKRRILRRGPHAPSDTNSSRPASGEGSTEEAAPGKKEKQQTKNKTSRVVGSSS